MADKALDKLFTNLLGQRAMGWLDYRLKPKLKRKFGGPFNGQQYRQKIYTDIMRVIDAAAIIETGTFRGTTTALFADSGLPVYTAEAHPRYFAYSSARFHKRRKQVHLSNADSRAFLRRLAAQELYVDKAVFFYLDAHWEQDLPLLEEVEIIFNNWPRAVVMIDDFKVPETDYTYDDYGSGKSLTPEYLVPLTEMGFVMYFPTGDASLETGKKRGCAILCSDPELVCRLHRLACLRRTT